MCVYVMTDMLSMRSTGGTLRNRTISSMNGPLRALLFWSVLAGCGGGGKTPVDASTDAEPDAAFVALDCPSYCSEVQANCTGTNAQYPDMAHCTATCASFAVGTSQVTDTSGNTLGCRIYHGGAPAKMAPATHCAHAGPAGDQITATPPAVCSGGNVCESFCALEIKACGSLNAPLPGNPRDMTGNPLFQYQNMASCMTACATYDKTHVYSTTSAGDSLACRLLHATSAAIAVTPNGEMECQYTGTSAKGPCAGPPTP